ncbi:MAG: hypothetical protein ACRCXZ_09970, partial [Patescibacteria group bacterium]
MLSQTAQFQLVEHEPNPSELKALVYSFFEKFEKLPPFQQWNSLALQKPINSEKWLEVRAI